MPDARPAGPGPAATPGPNRHAAGHAEESPADRLMPDPDASEPPAAERDLWSGRTRWTHYLGRLGLLAACVVVFAITVGWGAANWEWLGGGGAFWLIAIPSMLLSAVVLWPVVMAVAGNRYRLTTQRLFIERGILSVTTDQLELIRVDDVRVHKTLVDRFCGLGTVEIVSTDATDKRILIEGIAEAGQVAEDVRKRMRTMRKKSLFVENL